MVANSILHMICDDFCYKNLSFNQKLFNFFLVKLNCLFNYFYRQSVKTIIAFSIFYSYFFMEVKNDISQSTAGESQEIETYTVQKSDTLASISLKFNVTIPWIKQLNGIQGNFIFTGQKLIINNKNVLVQTYSVENAMIFDPPPRLSGKLFLKEGYLSFTPKDPRYGVTLIDLTGHLESAIMPSPQIVASKYSDDPIQNPDAPVLWIITYTKDEELGDPQTICFEGVAREFNVFAKNVQLQAEEVQRRHHEETLANSDLQIAATEDDIGERRSLLNSSLIIDSSPTFNPRLNPSMSMPIGSMPRPMINQIKRNIIKPIRLEGESKILSEGDAALIRPNLPYQYRNATWKLLFQLSTHGSSYVSFYEKCMNHSPVVLVILTDKRDRIGAFSSKPFKISKNFYGNGETFVFTFQPQFHAYKWQNSNQYFISSSKNDISIGGGGAAAIWMDGSFNHAFSEACQTFNSPILTQSSHFKILDVEVWLLSDLL